MNDKLKINKITVYCVTDNDADVSYLDGSNHLPHNPANWNHVSDGNVVTAYNKAFGVKNSEFNRAALIRKLDELYAEQDKERLEHYGLTWRCVGIYAQAEVSYSIGNGSSRRESLKSAGLWGIESDSEQSYLKEVECEQLNELKEHLEVFSVDVSEFDRVQIEYKGDCRDLLD